MIKCAGAPLTNVIMKLFNGCLKNGVYPWKTSVLSPIPKSGDKYNPDNYRAIALGSCLAKLFSSILLKRIIEFRNQNCPDYPNQLGFTAKAQTNDHIFCLKTLIEKYASRPNLKLYTCFVDFRKAFDSVARDALFYKISSLGIGGCYFKTLKTCMTILALE